MKFNMYAPTMFQMMSKTAVKIITFILIVAFVGIVGLCLYSCFLESLELFFTLLVFIIILFFIVVNLKFTPEAYIEVDGENIKVVDYILFVKREKIVKFSQIHRAYIGVAKSCRKTLLPLKLLPHEIVFEDEDGKKLFTVYHTEESYEVFKDYIVNYDIYLKNIE